MITPFELYLILQADALLQLIGIGIILWFVLLFFVIIVAYQTALCEEEQNKNENKDETNIKLGDFWTFVKGYLLIGFLLGSLVVIIPSTKNLIYIYSIPKIVNSEYVQEQMPEDVKEVYGSFKDYLLEFNKDKKDKKAKE